MTAPGRTRPAQEVRETGCYVYGILPGDVELTPDARGLRDHEVDLVRHGDIAALVSDIDLGGPIGRPEDLTAHERLLDGAAVEVPVLPMRFGAVLTSREAVERELLAANHDQFLAALDEIEGRVEYIVKGRYEERAVLREIMSENPDAAGLLEQIRDRPEELTRDARIRLGEFINQAISAKRDADTQWAAQALSEYAQASVPRRPTHPEDAVQVAFLVETDRRSEFERAVAKIAEEWQGRVDLRLLGPTAPYDFVITPSTGA
ncbi:GvpL/GvpF family gas vesicle protein [Actinoallomurus rhizosphaericola]|uniref:GvpL/GvpF family gas vesicle protein n=1 Tax=Actinoallomurus rhizosphaericola TaxID=2952536 RepID=UPI0020925EEF|nr:GvpL/GvpF family gas vesicle protein [Actinoallomurus rhizosphaericola]MCO5998038.1 GvpL/GvpF family gas vesicle protein [Actinoallomurus rhizosphaericola]